MELNKENMKKIRGLILFTILIVVLLVKYEVALDGVKFILNILFPFLLGAAIAFIINVPMNFLNGIFFRISL